MNNSADHTLSLYDRDLVAWAAQQAALIRERRFEDLDVENLAQEVEDLAKSQRRELNSRICNILEHMIKLEVLPATDPRADWHDTIRREHQDIEALLDDNPSLRREVDDIISRQLPIAKRRVIRSSLDRDEHPTRSLDGLDYTSDQVLWSRDD
jgi:Domain of unknown function DUF29